MLESLFNKVTGLQAECGKMRESVRMRENADQKNSDYVHFSRSVNFLILTLTMYLHFELAVFLVRFIYIPYKATTRRLDV